jgi:hypothetical protein
MTDRTDTSSATLVDLLARWQAFSELQQRAFAYLAAEALSAGQEFESSTEGATRVLTHIADVSAILDPVQVQAETWAVVHKLQAADRSRQGLEQVASVLEMLCRQHAELVQATCRHQPLPEVGGITEAWIEALGGCVSLSDWRRRLNDALHGREPVAAEAVVHDEELF